MTLIRCGGLFCVSLVSHYLNDIPCKNYNYVFVFVKVMPKILLVPFSGHSVYCFYSDDKSTKRISFEVYHFDVSLMFLHWGLTKKLLDAYWSYQITGRRRWSCLAPFLGHGDLLVKNCEIVKIFLPHSHLTHSLGVNPFEFLN